MNSAFGLKSRQMTRQNSSVKPSPQPIKEEKKKIQYQNSLLESFYSEGFDGPDNQISRAQSRLPRMDDDEKPTPARNTN